MPLNYGPASESSEDEGMLMPDDMPAAPVEASTPAVHADMVPLEVPLAVALALDDLVLALRTDTRFRQRVLLAVGRVQQHFRRGPLTAVIEALVAEDAHE